MGSSLLSLLAIDKFDDPDYSDCEVHVGDKIFRVSTLCLKLHSDVFFACFHHDTVERKTGVVKIEDASVNLVELMLRFMYSGEVENLDEEAYSLFILADRYNVVGLMKLCAQSMCNSLQINTIFNCLNVAYRLNAEELKRKCLQYVADNADKIIDQQEWTVLTDQEPGISRDFSRLLSERLLERNVKVTELESRLERCSALAAPSRFFQLNNDNRMRDAAVRMRGEVDRLNERMRNMQREMANVLVADARAPNRRDADAPVPGRAPNVWGLPNAAHIHVEEVGPELIELVGGLRDERFYPNPVRNADQNQSSERNMRQGAVLEQNQEIDRLLTGVDQRQMQIQILEREIGRLERLRTEARNEFGAIDAARRNEQAGRILGNQVYRFNMQLGVTRRRLNQIIANQPNQARNNRNMAELDRIMNEQRRRIAENAQRVAELQHNIAENEVNVVNNRRRLGNFWNRANIADQANQANADQADPDNDDQVHLYRNRRRRNFPFVNDDEDQAQRRRRRMDLMEMDRILNAGDEYERRLDLQVADDAEDRPVRMQQPPRLAEINVAPNEAHEVNQSAESRRQALMAAIEEQARQNAERGDQLEGRVPLVDIDPAERREVQIENDMADQEQNYDSDVEIIDDGERPGPSNQNGHRFNA